MFFALKSCKDIFVSTFVSNWRAYFQEHLVLMCNSVKIGMTHTDLLQASSASSSYLDISVRTPL